SIRSGAPRRSLLHSGVLESVAPAVQHSFLQPCAPQLPKHRPAWSRQGKEPVEPPDSTWSSHLPILDDVAHRIWRSPVLHFSPLPPPRATQQCFWPGPARCSPPGPDANVRNGTLHQHVGLAPWRPRYHLL